MVKQFEYDSLPIIETKQGKIRGYKNDGVYIFKGVRYATAKRFQMPEEVKTWEGVKEAGSYGFISPTLEKDEPNGEILIPHRYWPQDEDCLNLNIWTTTLDKGEKRPVIVWFHGGGFSTGSSIEQKAYNGENMSKYGDVVVVTVNHRLNILGYFDMSPYGEKYADSANAGQEDLIAALRWVQQNIIQFGGNPDNVTIMGQSGGGMKVSSLLQMPAADGLFHKGIIMSGVIGEMRSYKEPDSKPMIQKILNELNLTEDEVEKLETVPYYELAEAYKKVISDFNELKPRDSYVGCMPKVNEYYLGEGQFVGFREHAKQIPLMVGSCFGEFTTDCVYFNKYEISQEELDKILIEYFDDGKDEVIAEFRKAYPGKNIADVLALDKMFRLPSKKLIESFAEEGGTVYSYLFTLEFPYKNGKTAYHCADIPFVFHNTELVPVANIEGVTEKLEKQMFEAIMQFARTGNPNHSGISEWKPCTKDEENIMIFDRKCEVKVNYDHNLLALHEKYFDMMKMAKFMKKQAEKVMLK